MPSSALETMAFADPRRLEFPDPGPNLPPLGDCEDLSPRELEIARLIAKGYPNKTIAGILEISPWTVGTYLRRIYAKLGVHCRAAMVARLMTRDT